MSMRQFFFVRCLYIVSVIIMTLLASDAFAPDENTLHNLPPALQRQLDATTKLIPTAVRSNTDIQEANAALNELDRSFGNTTADGGKGRYYLTFQRLVERLAAADRYSSSRRRSSPVDAIAVRIFAIIEKVSKSARHLRPSQRNDARRQDDDATFGIEDWEVLTFRRTLSKIFRDDRQYSDQTIAAVIYGFGFISVRQPTVDRVAKMYRERGVLVQYAATQTARRWEENKLLPSNVTIPTSLKDAPLSAVPPSPEEAELEAHSEEPPSTGPTEETEPATLKDAPEPTNHQLALLKQFLDPTAEDVDRVSAGLLFVGIIQGVGLSGSKDLNPQCELLLNVLEATDESETVRRTAAVVLLVSEPYLSDSTIDDPNILRKIMRVMETDLQDPVTKLAFGQFSHLIRDRTAAADSTITDFWKRCPLALGSL